MLALLRSVSDERFTWLRNVFLKSFEDWLNPVQETLQKETSQKMLARNCTYRAKHMKD